MSVYLYSSLSCEGGSYVYNVWCVCSVHGYTYLVKCHVCTDIMNLTFILLIHYFL